MKLTAALVAILLLGLGPRLDYAWDGREPVFDAASYAKIAANLEEGRGFTLGEGATQPASNYSPGVPLLVAGIYELTGGVHERLARIVLALIGALAVLFTYLIGRRLSGPIAGLIGAAAVAVYPALLEYQGMLMGEPLAATLLSGAVLTTLGAAGVDRSGLSRGWRGDGVSSSARSLRRKTPHPWYRIRPFARSRAQRKEGTPPRRQDPRARWLVPGLLFGALALVRPEYLGVALLIAIVVLVRDAREEWRCSLTQGAVLLIGVALVVAPWTIRNAVALDRFVPISTGGGQVLFAGTYLPSDGDPERVGAEVLERHPGLTRRLAADYLPAGAFLSHSGRKAPVDAVLERVRLEQILAALAAQRYPGVETDRALARMGRERLWNDLSEHPLEHAGFVATKVGRIWSHGPRGVMRQPAWEALHWALVAFGLLGLVVLARRRRWEALALATVFLSITAISALLVASPRRVLVMLPLVAALAGVGATWFWASLHKRALSSRVMH